MLMQEAGRKKETEVRRDMSGGKSIAVKEVAFNETSMFILLLFTIFVFMNTINVLFCVQSCKHCAIIHMFCRCEEAKGGRASARA